MSIHRQISDISQLPGPLHLALGVFDGVHLGHQAVMSRSLESAKNNGGTVLVVTFDPHPATILSPEHTPQLLTTIEQKARLLDRLLGIEHVLAIPFDRDFSQLSGETFIRQLCEAATVDSIAVGEGFQFGHKRSGDLELLQRLAHELGYRTHETPIHQLDGETVSSTRIRQAIEQGDLELASHLLGRTYRVAGTVIKGMQKGRTIGFPTANLDTHCEQLPPTGVYAVRAYLGDTEISKPGVANLGYRPTVTGGDAELLLEVHLFDFQSEIYGQEMEVEFVEFLRGEEKFDSFDALKQQILNDAETARRVLS